MILPHWDVQKHLCNIVPVIRGIDTTSFVWNVVVWHIILGNRQRCGLVGL
jgi:hypothetical protein